MYLLLSLLRVGAGIPLARVAYVQRRPAQLWAGGALAVGTLVLFPLRSLWADAGIAEPILGLDAGCYLFPSCAWWPPCTAMS